MTTQLFFRNDALASCDQCSLGTNALKLDITTSGWLAPKPLRTTRGGAKVAVTVATVLGPTSGLEFVSSALPMQWISPPIDQDVTISGTITFNLWMGENATTDNAGAQCVIQRVDYLGDLALGTFINSEKGVELPKTSAIAAQNWTAAPTSTAFFKGDRIRIRPACNDAGGTMAVDATGCTFDYAGTTAAADGDSYVTFTETFGFLTADPTTQSIYPTTTVGQVDPGGAGTDTFEAWTSRGSGVTTAVRNTAAGWTVPLQMTVSAGGNLVEWFTRRLTAFTLAGPVLVNVRGLESDALANATFRVEVAITNSLGASAIPWGRASWPTEPGTSEAAQVAYVTGADLAVTAQQRIRIRFYIDDASDVPMGASQTVTLDYAGTSGGASGDTFLTFGQTLTESPRSLVPDTRRVKRNVLLRM